MAALAALFGLSLMAAGLDPQLHPQTLPVADSRKPAEIRVTERGPHHRVDEFTVSTTDAEGKVVTSSHRYVALETGMHYMDDSSWKQTRAEFDEYADGFAALEGPHKVILSRSLRVQGAVDLQTADGTRMRSTPLQLVYRDRVSGKVAILGNVRESSGVKIAPGVVLWADAFEGIRADYRATYRAGSFECDVILREAPPSAKELGLDPESTQIQVITEFYDTKAVTSPLAASESDTDTHIQLGEMEFGRGSAFGEDLPGNTAPPVSVSKEWTEMEGRRVLIESVWLGSSGETTDDLPQEGAWLRRPAIVPNHILPEPLMASTTPGRSWREAAACVQKQAVRETAAVAPSARPGFVIDYVVVNTVTNFTFSSTNTYYVSGAVNLSGTVTFQPMTVIKYASTNSPSLNIQPSATLNWLGEPYHPVFMTAKDDNSVGETITGSTGSPSGTYAATALKLDSYGTASRTIRDFRIAYASLAINCAYGSTKHLIRHGQFVKCDMGIQGSYGAIELQNVLMDRVKTNFYQLYFAPVNVYFATFDSGNKLNYNPTSSTMTNYAVLCTSIADTSGAVFDGGVLTSTNSTGFYQTAAAGKFYLSPTGPTYTNSNFRWYGSLPSELGVDADGVSHMSDTAPAIVSGTLANSLWLGQPVYSVTENTSPDWFPCGYKYWALDVILSNAVVPAGKTLYIGGGCAQIGAYGSQGFLSQGGSVTIEGAPQARSQILRVAAIQEEPGATTLTNATFQLIGGTNRDVKIRFTDIDLIPSEGGNRRLFHDESTWNGTIAIRDSRLWGVKVQRGWTPYGGTQSFTFQNNIFQDCHTMLEHETNLGGTFGLSFYNNLVRGGWIHLLYAEPAYGTWNVRDSFFVSTDLYYENYWAPTYIFPSSNNGYYQASPALPGTGNISITNLNWAIGPLGPLYYATGGGAGNLTSLVDAGSRSAGTAGLYHHATRTDQTKDSGNVDIGFHYIATTSSISTDPEDTDLDGLRDYAEDLDGSGSQNGSESHWNGVDTDGDGLSDPREMLIGTSPTANNADGDSLSDETEYLSGTDPTSTNNYPATVLDRWSFNSTATGTVRGTAPLTNTATFAESYDGLAVCFTNSSAKVTYPSTVSSGGTNYPTMTFKNGTIRFTYVSDWSVNGSPAVPNQWVRLIECGDWKLSISPDGRDLVFDTPMTGGGSRTSLRVPIRWGGASATRKQCQITLTYSPGSSRVHIQSGIYNYSVTGYGVQSDLATNVIAAGWTLGNSATGGTSALGYIDELETFGCLADPNAPGESNVRFARFYDPQRRQANVLSASAVTNGIRLEWVRGWEGDWTTNSGLYGISRRTAGSSSFSSVVTGVRTNVWVDTNATAGIYYEYRIDRNSVVPALSHPLIVASRSGAAIDQRGRAILMIDQTLTNSLWNDFEAYKRQLAADGWTVTNYYVPRHFDQPVGADCATYHGNTVAGWRANTNNMATIKGHIRREYTNNPTATNVVILIGHVPIPYSGLGAEDGHGCGPGAGDHGGAWTSDSWYGDMTGTWTDSASYNNCSFCINDNVANDGKFDNNTIPTESGGTPGRLEMPLGRIDFANLPEFGDGVIFPGATNSAQAEVKLFQRYFDKTLRFRRNGIGFLRQSKTFQGDGAFHEMIGGHQWINSRAFGSENFETDSKGTDLFLATTNYLWGSHGDYGFFTTMGNGQYPMDRRHYSSEIASGSEAPRGMFMLLDGSYMADWNSVPDDLMRVCLGMPDSVLTVLWGRNHRWRTERVHAGAGIHTMLEDTLSSGMTASSRRSLLGDPTLRERYITPVSVFTATKSGSNAILSWSTNADADAGYRIYRATATNALSWALVGTAASGATSWTNAPSSPSSNAYMIKAAGIRTSGSGSTTILGHGVIATNVVVIP